MDTFSNTPELDAATDVLNKINEETIDSVVDDFVNLIEHGSKVVANYLKRNKSDIRRFVIHSKPHMLEVTAVISSYINGLESAAEKVAEDARLEQIADSLRKEAKTVYPADIFSLHKIKKSWQSLQTTMTGLLPGDEPTMETQAE